MKKFLILSWFLFIPALIKAASISGPAGLFIQIGDSIDELGDVDTTGKATGSCFIYDGVSGNWEAALCPGGTGASTLEVSIGEVQVTSPTVTIDFSSHVFTVTQDPSGESNVGLKGSSVTLMGNSFNAANVLVKLSGSALIPNALIDNSSVTKLGPNIALGTETSGDYVASLVAGLGITVGSAGAGATPTVTFTPSLVTGNQTFGANNTSAITWCFGIIGTDPCFTFSDDLITVTNLTVSGTLTAGAASVTTLSSGGISYPTVDGAAGQSVITDGAGNLYFTTIGSGSGVVAVSSGGVIVSSPTAQIDFSSTSFTVELVGLTSAYVDLGSIVTQLGATIELGSETVGDYVSSITVSAPLLANTSGHVFLSIDKSSVTLLGPTIDSDELPLHSGAHEAGEIDEIDVNGLSGLLADRQKIFISTDGTQVAISSGINFVPGDNVTITGLDNNGVTDITISATGGGGGYALEPATVTIKANRGIAISTTITHTGVVPVFLDMTNTFDSIADYIFRNKYYVQHTTAAIVGYVGGGFYNVVVSSANGGRTYVLGITSGTAGSTMTGIKIYGDNLVSEGIDFFGYGSDQSNKSFGQISSQGFRLADSDEGFIFHDYATGYDVILKSSDTIASDFTWTFPSNYGVAGYWKTDADGNLSVSSDFDTSTLTATSRIDFPALASKTLDTVGQSYFDTTDGTLVIHDGTSARVFSDEMEHFSVTLSTWYVASNWANDTFPIWQAPREYAITIASITATAFSASASSVTFNIEERAFNALNSAGTDVFTVAEATANVTGCLYGPSAFTNAGIAAGAYLVWDTDLAASGATAKAVILTIYYRRDLE